MKITTVKGEFMICTDKRKLDIAVIHHFLANNAYWCKDIPLEKVQDSIKNSLCFGLYHFNKQAGLARVISDFSTFAYLCDVFILPEYRGKGLSKWLMEQIMAHPHLQGLRRWMLLTADAHGLYKQFGWSAISAPERYMEIHHKDIYQSGSDN